MKKLLIKLTSIFMILTMLSGCVNNKVNVVVTSYPLQFLVERIAGDRVSVTRLDTGNVAQRSQISKEYEKILKNADVIFYINEAQPYFEIYEEALKSSSAHMVDLSEYSKLYDFKRYQNINVNGQIQSFESPYYETTLLDDYDMYDSDPILWIYPRAMVSMGRSILDYLVSKNPEYESYYTQNFEELEVELVRLYAEYQKLKDVDTPISFVSVTPSYGNWQKSYGINVYPLVLSKYGVIPDEALLNVYREKIIEDGVGYIVYEENLPEDYIKLFNQTKTELSLTQINLHSLYTLSEKDIENKEDYISLMYKNLETLLALGE